MKCAIVHIADIHYRKDEPEGALTILNALFEDIKKQKENLKSYDLYLAITGDIVFSGNDGEAYSSFHKQFNEKLNGCGITKEYRLVVPGNHDIDSVIIEKCFDEYREKINKIKISEPDFNNNICDIKIQDEIFENYLLFESDFSNYGINYFNTGCGWKLNDNIGVFCLNTALCSFAGVNHEDDKNNLAVFTRGLIEWCSATDTSTNILLMHHPLSHLINWSEDALKQIIEKHFSLCLCGHKHEQNIYYNKISNNSLICIAPQVFTSKEDLLGYAIIIIEDNFIDRIIYREYIKGQFFNGQRFSENSDGIVLIKSDYRKSLEILEYNLKSSLSFFKSQPEVFIKPKISKEREFDNTPNLLEEIIKNPRPSLIVSHPQFGLTCLSHYMRIEAFKSNNFWVYFDSKHLKARKIDSAIETQLKEFNKKTEDIKCIIIDSWDSSIIDHRHILKHIDSEYENITIIVMSNYSGFCYDINFNFSDLNSDLEILHLQAMQRNKVREFVSEYNKEKNIGNEDLVVTKVVKDLEALNVHRTPFNCLTLLKVFERDFNESLVNRTKMIQAVLFILFTDADSFTYATNKPNVDDCEYILGRFCKKLIEKHIRSFKRSDFIIELEDYCKEKLISIDIDSVLSILESNNIILRFGDFFEFKHSYWIYYFAATYMQQDDDFREYILKDKKYVNYPEIIEFYTGIDGRKGAAISALLNDLTELNETVKNKIGITEDFYPFDGLVWDPSESTMETIRKDISEKVQQSNLPTAIKDQHADEHYNSEAPYDQSIRQFLNDYSVVSLIHSIKASSRALRNSKYIDTELKKRMMQEIINGWDQISKVLFWLSPKLAKEGCATYDGLQVLLIGSLDGSPFKRLESIITSNPYNIVHLFKDDLSSMKIGPLVFNCLENNKSLMQKHFLSLFLIKERPIEWHKNVFEFMNLLHRNSFILGNLYTSINTEIEKGFSSDNDTMELKMLLNIVAAKLGYASKSKIAKIPQELTINEKNKLPIDKILSIGKKSKSIK